MAVQKAAEMEDEPEVSPTRFVAFHSPGPGWKAGVAFFEQAGVDEHAAHYAGAMGDGKLELGGPFLDESGGMMVFARGLDRAAVDAIAQADPAVRSGLLKVDVRPWMAALSRE
jgi:uncharacterized protein YciI